MSSGETCELPRGNASDDEARELMRRYKTVAVVGLSRDPNKPGHFVAKYLKEHGYRIIPVNPTAEGELLGEKVYGSLREIPEPVEIVEIFRKSEEVPAIVEDAIAIGAKAVWMQQGIVHNAAAERARQAGLVVVMDKCMMAVHAGIKG